jgi:hypothetical protein
MLNPFKRKKPSTETAELPADVLAIIEGLSVVARSDDDEGNARVLVQAGNAALAWYHSKSESSRMISVLFPDLNSSQIDRAVMAINSKAKAALLADRYSTPHRPKWSASHWEDRKL